MLTLPQKLKQMKKIYLLILYICLALLPANAQTWKAGTLLSEEELSASAADKFFTSEDIPNDVFARMKGKSFAANCTVARSSLCYLRMLHYNRQGKVQRGEMVCNKAIAQDLIDIFRELFKAKYIIERMVLVDEYDAVDEKTMTANNTSCFNFRFITGTRRVSKHGQGMAVDINPLYNPCYNTRNGKVEPAEGKPYAKNRTDKKANPMLIDHKDLCYRLFISHGFRWGGNWKNKKDYQHFEK